MRWILFIMLASVAVSFADDQLIQQAMKNNALMVTKTDVVRFTNYSSKTQLKLNGKVSVVRFTTLSSATQSKLNGKVDKTTTVNGQPLSGNVNITTISGNAGSSSDSSKLGGQIPAYYQAASTAITTGNIASQTVTTATGNAGTATKLATGRTLAITGPITYTSPSFDGSGNVTAAATVTSQTGTGSKFVMDTSPVLVTPTIGDATASTINSAFVGNIVFGVTNNVTKTVTVTFGTGSTYISGHLTFGSYGTAGLGASNLDVAVGGYMAAGGTYYNLTELVRWVGSGLTLSAITKGTNSFTFTATTGASNNAVFSCVVLSNVPVTITVT